MARADLAAHNVVAALMLLTLLKIHFSVRR